MSQIDATAIMAASLSAARVLRIWQHRSMDNETELRARCGVVVIDDRNRVLLIRRSGEGSWGVPGGGIEVGETWQQAARRECQEETGRDIDLHDLLGLYSNPAPDTPLPERTSRALRRRSLSRFTTQPNRRTKRRGHRARLVRTRPAPRANFRTGRTCPQRRGTAAKSPLHRLVPRHAALNG